MADNSRYVYNWLTQRGYKPYQAAAMVGHAEQESGVRPDGVTGDNGTANGMFQWRGERFDNLKNFARANGVDWRHIDTQLEFLDHELNTTEKYAGDRLRGSTDVRSATRAGMDFERPQGYTKNNPEGGHGWSNRYGTAQRFANTPPAPTQSTPTVASAFGAPGDGREGMSPTATVNVAAVAPAPVPSGLAAAFGPNPIAGSAPETAAPSVGVADLFGAPPSTPSAIARVDEPAAATQYLNSMRNAPPTSLASSFAPEPAAPTPAPVLAMAPEPAATPDVAGETGGMAGLGSALAGLFSGAGQAQSNPNLGRIASAVFADNGGDDFEKRQRAREEADKRRRRLAFGSAPIGQAFA